MGIGMRELVIILLVVLVVFGAKKLRSIGSDLGEAVKGFKKAVNDGDANESGKQIRREGADASFDDAPGVAQATAPSREPNPAPAAQAADAAARRG
jgi:sec-independent protein translocase protein TatA